MNSAARGATFAIVQIGLVLEVFVPVLTSTAHHPAAWILTGFPVVGALFALGATRRNARIALEISGARARSCPRAAISAVAL